MVTKKHEGGKHYVAVSVPLRGCGFKIVGIHLSGDFSSAFPSPCGDVVLKLDLTDETLERIKEVSVPLRGCGFKIVRLKPADLSQNVSVPLRGCGFKMRQPLRIIADICGFRPLAGMWF